VLDLSQVESLDKQLVLKVAAVKQGKVINSTRVDLSTVKDISSIPVTVEYSAKERKIPIGVNLMVGPDAPDEKFLFLKPLKRWISGKYDWKDFAFDAKKWVIPKLIFPWWWIWCRVYTIQGQVVCHDGNPVPGATVNAYDVDRWWWCRKDKVGSAVTDANGNFEIKFFWCCRWWWWFPLLKKKWDLFIKDWELDPYLVGKIKELFDKEGLIEHIPKPDPKPNLEVFENLLQDLEAVKGGDVSTRMVAAPNTLENTREALVKLLPGTPELKLLHCWPWWPWWDCKPDIIFKVTQDCGEPDTVIYEEDCSDTRWNIPTTLNVTLMASNACCGYVDEIPEGNGFKFGEVCRTPVPNIGGNDPDVTVPAELLGYAYPDNLDRPFGETLELRGVFCEDADVDYYKVRYSTDGVTFNDMDETMLVNFNRIYWGAPPDAPTADPQWNWVLFKAEEKSGQLVFKSREKFEQEHEPTSWGYTRIWTSNADVLIYWISGKVPDGLYTLQVIGYNEDTDGSLINERVMPTCAVDPPEDELLKLRIDNRTIGEHPPSTPDHPCGPPLYVHQCTLEPDCDFIRIAKNEDNGEGEEVGPCGIIKLTASDTLTIHFNASDKDGHLLGYAMSARYAESGYVNLLTEGTLYPDLDPQYGPYYNNALTQSASRPHWYGGNFKLVVPGSAFPTCCAYLLRLRVWKRTFNGCTSPYYFHWNVCEITFTIIREDLIGDPLHPECKE
jgi:hypothetical protein